MSVVTFQSVTLEIAGRSVLRDVSFDIGPGEFIGLLGPNGAGKTTLLRAILGILPAERGTITVFGQPAANGNPQIGYVPQLRSQVDGLLLSAWDFVAGVVNGHRFGLPWLTAEDRKHVDWALDLVGGTALARRPLSDLSGGERQRLLLAQALIGRPKLLLLDEPLISLDPAHQHNAVELVKSVQAELGIPVLFSSHELNPLLGVLDRVLYLGHSHAAIGSVGEVITSAVLSRLYGAPIDVVSVEGRIFILSGGYEVDREAHLHEHEHHHAAI